MSYAVVTEHRNDGILIEGVFDTLSEAEDFFGEVVRDWVRVETERWGRVGYDMEVHGDWAHIDETVSVQIVKVGPSPRRMK